MGGGRRGRAGRSQRPAAAPPADGAGGLGQKRFQGVVKRLGACYGFISSPAAAALYGRDIFAHKRRLWGFFEGSAVEFSVIYDGRGRPQAANVTLPAADAVPTTPSRDVHCEAPTSPVANRTEGEYLLEPLSPAGAQVDASTAAASVAPVLLQLRVHPVASQAAESWIELLHHKKRAAVAVEALQLERAARLRDEAAHRKERERLAGAVAELQGQLAALRVSVSASETRARALQQLYCSRMVEWERHRRDYVATCFDQGLKALAHSRERMHLAEIVGALQAEGAVLRARAATSEVVGLLCDVETAHRRQICDACVAATLELAAARCPPPSPSPGGTAEAAADWEPPVRSPREARRAPERRAGSAESGGSLSSASTQTQDPADECTPQLNAISALFKSEAQARQRLVRSCGSALCVALADALHSEAADLGAAASALRADLSASRREAAEMQEKLRLSTALRQIEQRAACMPWQEVRAREKLASQAAAGLDGIMRLCARRAQVRPPARRGRDGLRHRDRSSVAPQGATQGTAQRSVELTDQQVFSIGPICRRVAEFAPFEWAQFSGMAPMTLSVLEQWLFCWKDGMTFAYSMQNVEMSNTYPQPSPTAMASIAFQLFSLNLKQQLRGPDYELKSKLLCRVIMIQIIFEEFKVRFGDLFYEMLPFYESMRRFYDNLYGVLRVREARLGAS
eukprot:TRINITY_DN14525_c0_g1_i4.p1 TRINITY_DN14525_c0_g1~~TRINITY_DN14525_c0_g1_i4.p1  ORF type:complete len:687 (+),score=144.77 TRINITY_DN14525_c0_g1_i4:74-2134(+)